MASMTVAIVILMLFIENAFASTKSYNSVHKTKEAAEVKADLYCYSCDMMSDAENCVNINKTRERNLTRKCDPSQEFCSVKRFSYTMSDKNSTSEKKLWSLQRNCSTQCESGCIIIGERVKLYSCSSCCTKNLCNTSNLGHSFDPAKIIHAMMLFVAYLFRLS